MPKDYLRDRKATVGMKVMCLHTARHGEVLEVDVPKDVEVPEDATSVIRVGNSDEGYVLVRYQWKPGGVNKYAPSRGCYGIVRPECLVSRESGSKLTL